MSVDMSQVLKALDIDEDARKDKAYMSECFGNKYIPKREMTKAQEKKKFREYLKSVTKNPHKVG